MVKLCPIRLCGSLLGDSDGSDFDAGKYDVDETVMSTKRIVRRIRRHLNYLDKHWAELNRSMLAYRQQLDRAFQVNMNKLGWVFFIRIFFITLGILSPLEIDCFRKGT